MKQTDQHHDKLGYTIPEGYFEASKKEMLSFLGANKSSKNTINKKSSYALLSYSIIGIFLVGLFFVKQNTWQEIKAFEQLTIESLEVNEEEFDSWFDENFILNDV